MNLARCKSTCPNLACCSPPWSRCMSSTSPGPPSQTPRRMSANQLASFQGLLLSSNLQLLSFILNQYLIHQLPLEILFNDFVAARTQHWHRVFRPPQLHLARMGKRTHTSPPSPLLGLLSGSSVSSTHPSPPQDRYNSHNRKY